MAFEQGPAVAVIHAACGAGAVSQLVAGGLTPGREEMVGFHTTV